MEDSVHPSSLGGLVAALNVAFGHRLSRCYAESDTVTFEQVVHVAEGIVDDDPRAAAVHLAGLIALDITRHAGSAHEHAEPLLN